MATEQNSGGFIYDPVAGTPVDKPTADNAQARWLQIDAKATSAEQGSTAALATLGEVKLEASQAKTAAQQSASSAVAAQNAAVDAEGTAERFGDDVELLKQMAEISPGSVTDAQTALLIQDPASETHTRLNAQTDQTMGVAQLLPPARRALPAWSHTNMLYYPGDAGWSLVTGSPGVPATDGTTATIDARPGPFTRDSVKMTRVSVQVYLQSPTLDFDFTAGPLLVWFYSPTPNPHGITVRLYTSGTNRYEVSEYAAKPALDPHDPGPTGWQVAEFHAVDRAMVGTPDPKNITSIHVRPTTTNSEVWVGAVGQRNHPLPYYNGVLTLFFDDGYLNQYELAAPVLASHGVGGVLSAIADGIDYNPAFMTATQARELQNVRGWEVAGHAYSGAVDAARYTSLTEAELHTEFSNLKRWLRRNGFDSDVWVSPGGQASKMVWDVGRKYFSVHRGVANSGESGLREGAERNSPYMAQPEKMFTPNWDSGTDTVDRMKTLIDRIKASKAWGSIAFHQILPDTQTPTRLAIKVGDLEQIVAYAAEVGVPIRTVKQVMDEVNRG